MTHFLKSFAFSLGCALVASPLPVSAQSAPSPATQPAQETADTVEGLSILFDLGSESIRPDQQGVLDQASRTFRDGNPVVMVVSGNADTVGSPMDNLELSLSRARTVADALVARGIPIERLQILGRGNSELPVPTDDDVANEQNRSVFISWR